MIKIKALFVIVFSLLCCKTTAQQAKTLWLDELQLQYFSEGMRPVSPRTNYGHDTMRINKKIFFRGIGAQSPCVLSFMLDKHAKHFSAMVGLDDLGNKEIPLSFFVVADKKVLFETKDMKMGDDPVKIDVDLTGITQLGLLITDHVGGVGNKRTYGNWANAQLEMVDSFAPGHLPDNDEKYILTPAPGRNPKINSAKLFGAMPGNPFLYTIAATGDGPMRFSAANLPKGITVSAQTGIISGAVQQKGTYTAIVKAKNKFGEATKKLIIVIGDTIALTPPVGWNGFNAWEDKIDHAKVMASARAMIKTGLINHGWTYINIDDSWQGKRGGPDTALQPNEKFPAIKNMIDSIHAMGLKAGLYSTPYIASYGGYVGASSAFPAGGETHETIKVNRPSFSHIAQYKFEENDAKQMAAWGVDFLKYDWRIDVASAERMSNALKKSGRDIVFSLSNNAPFEKVTDWARLSNMYRTGPDIKDTWTSCYLTEFSLDKWSPYAGHGHWNDPDMLVVGQVAVGPVQHPTRLTPDEQYSHISIYSLLAAPMLIGCPLETLDAFTLNLLSNDEIIEIDQDPLGKAARLLSTEDGVEVWVKPMQDGSYAVGLFNTDGYGSAPASYFRWGDETAKSCTFDFAKIGLKGKWKLHDVWRQKDLGQYSGLYKTNINHHGVLMLRMSPVK
jgi:alpha-galactosidase